MRLFTVLVFDQVVRGNVEILSSAEFDDQLGKADELVLEVEVEEASGTTPAITVRYHHCNSGKGTVALAPLLNGVSLASLPLRDVKTQSGPLGARGKVGVQLGSADNVARVRIWACGRSK